MAWPDGGSNEVKKTIGATGRQHATIAAWEADTDENCTAGWGAGDYASPCSPVGECYDDGLFTGDVYLYEATTSEDYYRRLTAAIGQRFSDKGDGTFYGGGVNGGGTSSFWIRDKFAVVEWIIFRSTSYIVSYYPPDGYRHLLQNALIACQYCGVYYARNCMAVGTSQYVFLTMTLAENCTAIGVDTVGYGVFRYVTTCTNCIAVGVPGSGKAFNSCGGDYNISEDTTAPGAHSIKSVDPEDLFVSVTEDEEDLHLKSDATAASGVGADLSAYFTIDIDGDTRSDWDIGADEYSGGGPPSFKSAWATGINSLVQ